MRVLSRERAARALAVTGLGALLRRTGAWRGVLVLCHHRVGDPRDSDWDRRLWSATAESLDAQARFLARECDVIAPADMEGALSGRGRHVMLTFDDGYRDNHDVALPILRAHGLRACFFVATGFLDEPRAPWWDEVAWMVHRSPRAELAPSEWMDRGLSLAPAERQASLDVLTARHKTLPPARSEAFLDALAEATGSGRCPTAEASELWMTWEMVRALEGAGMTVGGHTVSHPILALLDREEQAHEIDGCARRLREASSGTRCASSATRKASAAPTTRPRRECLRAAGVELAFSYHGGYARPRGLDRLAVPRATAEIVTTQPELAAMATLPQLFARW